MPPFKNFGNILLRRGRVIALGMVSAFFMVMFLGAWAVGPVSDSEIWSITLGFHLREEIQHYWVFTRPLFYSLLWIGSLGAQNSLEIFERARFVFLVNGLVTVLLLALVARVSFRAGWKTTLFTVILLLGNTEFLSQGYRVRSDLLAGSLFLLSLYFFMAAEKKRGAILLLPLLATPKAVFQILGSLIFLPASERRRGVEFFVFFLLLLAALNPESMSYLSGSLRADSERGPLLSLLRFDHLIRLLSQNLIFVAFFFSRIFTLTLRLRLQLFATTEEKEREQKLFILVGINLLIVVLFPEKVPYYLVANLPIFCLFAARVGIDATKLVQKMAPRAERFYLLSFNIVSPLVIISLILTSLAQRESLQLSSFWDEQKNAFSILEKYLDDHPTATYYDAIGILPAKAKHRFFVGPFDPGSIRYALGYLKHNPPDLLFYTAKLGYLEPELSKLIRERYLNFGAGVFARAEEILGSNPQKIIRAVKERKREAQRDSRIAARFSHKGWSEVVVTDIAKLPALLKQKRGFREFAFTFFLPPDPQPAFLINIFRFDRER
jgi:hypothetical membrane protein